MNRELLIALLGFAGLWSHSLDEIAVFGQSSGPPLPVQVGLTAVVLALVALHPRLGIWRVLPAALCALLGLFVTATGWTAHVQPLLQRGSAPADLSGVVFVLGGLLLVADGALILRQAFAPRPARAV